MITLNNTASYRSYFEDIKASHVDISHYYFGDSDVPKNNLQHDKITHALWVQPFESVSTEDQLSDNHQNVYTGTLCIMKRPLEDTFDSENAAADICEEIVKDIKSKILKDYNEGTIACDLTSFRDGQALSFPVAATKYVLWRLDFQFRAPAGLVYNEAKWI